MGGQPSRILPGLYLSGEEILVTEEFGWFREHGVGHVVSVCEETTPPSFLALKTLHVAAEDTVEYDLAKDFGRIIEFVHSARASGSGVLVHCRAGVSRSASSVIAYLMAEMDISAKKAFEHVKKHRSSISPNKGFLTQLVQFGRGQSTAMHRRLVGTYGTILISSDSEFVLHTGKKLHHGPAHRIRHGKESDKRRTEVGA